MGIRATIRRLRDAHAQRKERRKNDHERDRENGDLLPIALSRGRMHSLTMENPTEFYRRQNAKQETQRPARDEADSDEAILKESTYEDAQETLDGVSTMELAMVSNSSQVSHSTLKGEDNTDLLHRSSIAINFTIEPT